ncbi:MAG TPA: hypothetical protein VIJ63_14005 [Roseiarcus sp.]
MHQNGGGIHCSTTPLRCDTVRGLLRRWLDPLALSVTAGARSVNDPSGVNVAQVILFGGERRPGEAGMAMPAFGELF